MEFLLCVGLFGKDPCWSKLIQGEGCGGSEFFQGAGEIQVEPDVKANLLLTHFGNLKWTHPHGGERESVFRHRERATALICSAMAAQSVPSEEPGIKVAALLFALLTPGSSDGLKNAPIAFAKKTTS